MNKTIEKISNDDIIKKIKAFSDGKNVYLVGGAIRDFYLNNKNFDKDIIVDGENAESYAKKLAKYLNATFVPLDETNKIFRLVLEDRVNIIDVAGVIGNDLQDDLKRRDLTINSIALNLNTMQIIDINNGLEDLNNRIIKHIAEQNFIDDPLRLLRAYRFAAVLGFDLDSELELIIKKYADKINQPAIERINYELLKMFSGDFAAKSLINMEKSGILQHLFPIVNELKKVPPNLHHHLDLFNHSIETVKQVEKIYKNSSEDIKNHLDRIDFGAASRLAHLKLSAFLHDIGKPSTWTIEEDTGRHRFIKHDDVGAKMSSKILKTNKFSKKQIDYISKMVKYHIYPSHVVSAPEINEKIYMRLIRKMGNDVIDIIILAMADRYSARGVEITEEIINKNINSLQALLDYYLDIKESLKPLPKLLSGDEIMELLNIPPSVQLGTIIKALQEEQLNGNISSKEEAVSFVKKQI